MGEHQGEVKQNWDKRVIFESDNDDWFKVRLIVT